MTCPKCGGEMKGPFWKKSGDEAANRTWMDVSWERYLDHEVLRYRCKCGYEIDVPCNDAEKTAKKRGG